MKLIDHTSAYNSLTNLEYEVNEITGNGNYLNLLNLAWKIHEIDSDELIFGGF